MGPEEDEEKAREVFINKMLFIPAKKELQKLCDKGLTIKQIAKEYGVETKDIKYWIEKYGLRNEK